MRPGDILADRFVIDDESRRGGIGIVHRGWDLETERAVAIKLLSKISPVDQKRFEREAALLADAQLPGIVRHVHHGETEDGRSYLVMEWLEGETVADRLEHRGFDVAEAVALLAAVCVPLAELHARGLVHRDLKPENLILVEDAPTLIDFGLARAAADAEMRVTATGCVLGTPGYMAPEQIRGGNVDARADVFALGCLLYECLTGVAAFAGENFFAVRTKILVSTPAPLSASCPEAPAALVALLDAMLAKARPERLGDAGTVARAVAALGPIAPSPRRPWQATRAPTVRAAATLTLEQWSGIVLVQTARAGDSPERRDELSAALAGREEELRRVARGARLEVVDGGSLVAIVPTDRIHHRLAQQLLAVARGLAGSLPGALVIAASGDEPFEDLVDRSTRSLDELARAALFTGGPTTIFLDGATGAVLEREVELVRYAAGYRLA